MLKVSIKHPSTNVRSFLLKVKKLPYSTHSKPSKGSTPSSSRPPQLIFWLTHNSTSIRVVCDQYRSFLFHIFYWSIQQSFELLYWCNRRKVQKVYMYITSFIRLPILPTDRHLLFSVSACPDSCLDCPIHFPWWHTKSLYFSIPMVTSPPASLVYWLSKPSCSDSNLIEIFTVS